MNPTSKKKLANFLPELRNTDETWTNEPDFQEARTVLKATIDHLEKQLENSETR
jgi:hypothetical protein